MHISQSLEEDHQHVLKSKILLVDVTSEVKMNFVRKDDFGANFNLIVNA